MYTQIGVFFMVHLSQCANLFLRIHSYIDIRDPLEFLSLFLLGYIFIQYIKYHV